ncbi:helix-turn-helix transcriptional regulator [Terrilactibacillus sp. S3-3]|nr:helix-turn-helix transcriptional regulator [Terrilactibacillus sp. S3-3]
MNELQIGERLRSRRKQLNMTTQELADKINISQSYISRFENNRAIPDIDMLARILNALDTDLSTFFAKESYTFPDDLAQLIETAKTMSTDARIKLNAFLKAMKENN